MRQPYVDDLASRFAADCTVLRHGSAALVQMAEAALAGERPSTEAVAEALSGLLAQPGGESIDVIVNACTHFPLLEPELVEATGGRVQFVDGGPGIARRIAYLTQGQGWAETPTLGRAVFTGKEPPSIALKSALAFYGLSSVESL